MNNPLVSVIMPARNAGPYVADAIRSMLGQEWTNWELLAVENDCSDNTGEVIAQFNDPRIRHLRTPVAGLCHARNIGLANARGEFICFLDADDRLPPQSILARINRFREQPDLRFVDGIVLTFDEAFRDVRRQWSPDFRGLPYHEMGRMNPRCFSAITWMIRRSDDVHLEFDTSWTHLEDRVFFLSIAHTGRYDYVSEHIYHIRRHSGSLMTNYREMEQAFLRYLFLVKERNVLAENDWLAQKRYFHRMHALIYGRQLRVWAAARHVWRYFFS
jgi:teichuronic acid biosynthesis glycosyltransferase TuaG